MTTLTVDLEKIACDVALAPPVDRLALTPDARAAIDTAPKHAEDIDVRRVTCTPEIARDLIGPLIRTPQAYRRSPLLARDQSGPGITCRSPTRSGNSSRISRGSEIARGSQG
jgi:hypothetical protein